MKFLDNDIQYELETCSEFILIRIKGLPDPAKPENKSDITFPVSFEDLGHELVKIALTKMHNGEKVLIKKK